MFTPRQVSMGNKVYKLHIKHDAKKTSINIPPDHSIYQLKENIHSEFKVKPDHQILFCNGKLMDVSDYITIKQAKIPNGSKIICTKLSSKSPPPPQISLEIDETLKRLDHMEQKATNLELNVQNIDKERRKLNNEEVPLFHGGDRAGDYKKLKVECGKTGEQLMQLLESLDQMECTEGQIEQRRRRKQVATKLNTVLDRNDKIIEKLSLAIKSAS
eukprot:TRINITY_DN11013_c0_g1_i5.p1 TRINITY_DN11013_c0_g1~~TRINITY_DN11013_c0_g1_i5.p1  ORF type:complete len:215 (-),score=61.56 TRINITY_DN11013_c0_g1_i5:46-690(-)